jgi:hypothetical protein
MMVSGIPTASGYEERIRFSELEVVESGAIEHGVLSTLPEGNFINGWDVNVAGVGVKSVKRNVRYHKHAVSHSTSGFPSCKNSANYAARRISYSESNERVVRSTTLAVDMATSRGCIKGYAQNYPGRYYPHYPRKISRTQQPQT